MHTLAHTTVGCVIIFVSNTETDWVAMPRPTRFSAHCSALCTRRCTWKNSSTGRCKSVAGRFKALRIGTLCNSRRRDFFFMANHKHKLISSSIFTSSMARIGPVSFGTSVWSCRCRRAVDMRNYERRAKTEINGTQTRARRISCISGT